MPKSSIAMRTPRCLQLVQSLGDESGVGQERGLGEFEGEVLGCERGLFERVAHVLDEVGIEELLGGDVDADRDAGHPGCVPKGSLTACFAKDVPSDGQDEPGLFGERDEIVGFDLPFGGVVPAHESFEGFDVARVEFDERLIVHGELVVLERPAEVSVELVTFEELSLHVPGEGLVSVAPVGLGDVHRDVGPREQFVGVEGLRAVVRAADRGRDDDLAVVDRDRPAQRVEDAPGSLCAFGARCVLADDRELVPAEPCDRVAVSDGRVQSLGYLDEHAIAGLVTERVVDDLEVVEIAEQDRDDLTRAAGLRERVLEPVPEQQPVRETGEAVVKRLIGELAAFNSPCAVMS